MKLLLLISSERQNILAFVFMCPLQLLFPGCVHLFITHSPKYNKHKGCASQSSPNPQTSHFRNAHMHTHTT